MSLRLVASTPDFFAISGRSAVRVGLGFGCICRKCEREISAPFGYEGKLIWCLYCGMEAGFVPMVELPGGCEFGCGITREECLMIEQNIDRLDEWARERDYELGHVLFEF